MPTGARREGLENGTRGGADPGNRTGRAWRRAGPVARIPALGMALVVALGVATGGSPGAAAGEGTPDPAGMTDAALDAEAARLRKERQETESSPDAPEAWREMRLAQRQMEEARKEAEQQREPLWRRVADLQEHASVVEWGRRLAALDEEIRKIGIVKARRTWEAGRAMCRERHAVLAARAPAAAPALRALGLDVFTYPRVDGSTSTQPLAVLVAARCLGVGTEWVPRIEREPRVETQGSPFRSKSSGGPIGLGAPPAPPPPAPPEVEYQLAEFLLLAAARSPAEDRLARIVNLLLATNASTHLAYVNVIRGRSDLGLLARGPSASELAEAQAAAVALDVRPCARDALVFLVNAENPLRGLTTAQIRGIYAREIRTWSEVGGTERGIRAYQREKDSGSQELMRTLVMKEIPFDEEGRGRPLRLVAKSMMGPYDALTRDADGLAYSVWYYERYMAGSPRTRTLAVDGVEPTPETLRDGTYPYATDVQVVTRAGLPADHPAARLRDWLLSPEGQAVVAESGYVPIAAK